MTLSGLDVIARCADFEARATAYELRGWQWAFLHALDGVAELRDVAMAGGVDIDLAIDFVAESEAAGLVRVVSMTLSAYRVQNAIPEPESYEARADDLAPYEAGPPAWMMEQDHEEPIARHDVPVAEHPEAVTEWTPDQHVAEHREEPVAEHHEEPVAEHPAPSYEWAPDAHVAEYHEEPVAEHAPSHEYTPDTHEWTPDAHVATADEWTPDHYVGAHEAPLAEHHEEPVAEPMVPSYEWTPNAQVTDASSAVAGLMSMHPHEAAPVEYADADAHTEYAEHPSHDDAYLSGEPVSLSAFHDAGAPEAATNGHSTNGHSSYSWEPMSLVTTVDQTAAEPEHEHDLHPAGDLPDGISIQLSPGMDDHAEYAEHTKPAEYPEHTYAEYDEHAQHAEFVEQAEHAESDFEPHEQGSISFSFSPESEPAPAARPAAEYAASPAPEEAREPVHASVQDVVAAAEPPQQLRMDAQSAQNGKGDLVGNLIARAFTFRIK